MANEAAAPTADPIAPVQRVDIRWELLWGAIGAITAGVLAATASTTDAVRGIERGFTISTANTLLSIFPMIGVAVAFVKMTRAVDPVALNSLRRSGICVFALAILMSIASVFMDSFPQAAGRSEPFLGYLLIVICVLLLGYAGGFRSISFVFFTYLIVKYLIGWLTIGKRFNSGDAFLAVGVVLVCVSLLAYPIWFANCLRRAREKLGSSVLGVATVVCGGLAVMIVFTIWMVVTLAQTPGAENMDDQAMDEVLAPIVQRFNAISAVLELAFAVCVASMFLGVRRQLTAQSSPETRT
jgi:hypothetical protein